MKLVKLLILILVVSFSADTATSQNVLINILTQNSGIVKKGEKLFLEVSICNTDPGDIVTAYKLRPQISVPVSIVSISDTGHILPKGWTIIFNSGAVIRLSNGTDIVPANTCRTILIAIKGNNVGGPLIISGNLLFANGAAPGSIPSRSTTGDNPADNSSTTSCKVIN